MSNWLAIVPEIKKIHATLYSFLFHLFVSGLYDMIASQYSVEIISDEGGKE